MPFRMAFQKFNIFFSQRFFCIHLLIEFFQAIGTNQIVGLKTPIICFGQISK